MEASYEANKTLSIPQQQQQNDETEQPQVEKALTWVTKPNPRSSFLTKTCIKHSITLYIIQTSCLIIDPGTISKSYSWLKRRLRRTSPSRFSISAVMAANNELFPEPTFPITPISCPCKRRKKLFNFLRSKGRALRLLLYIAIFCVRLIVSSRNRTAERRRRQNAWVWQMWKDYYLSVLSGIHLTLMFFVLQKDLFQGMLSLAEGFFQTKLSHLHTRFALVFPLTICYVSSLLMCQPRAYWLLKQWVFFSVVGPFEWQKQRLSCS